MPDAPESTPPRPPALCVAGGLAFDAPGGHPAQDMARAWLALGGPVLYCAFSPSRWRRPPPNPRRPDFTEVFLPPRRLLPWSYPERRRARQVERSVEVVANAFAFAGLAPAETVFLYYGWFWDGFPERFPARAHVYDCIDESAGFPQVAARAARVAHVRAREARLLASVDLMLATSPYLLERQGAAARRAILLPNGIDRSHWRAGAVPEPSPALDRIERLPRPRAALSGHLQAKLDFALVDELARRRPDWGFALVGSAAGDARLPPERANLAHCGPARREALPGLLSRVDAGMAPLRDTPFNQASCPLKLLENLACGLPVATSRIPMAEYWRNYFPDRLFMADADAASWEQALALAFAARPRLAPLADEQLAPHDWTARARALRNAVGL